MIKKNNSSKKKDLELQKKLLHKTESSWSSFEHKKIFSFSKKYIDFLKNTKTERLSFEEIIKTLKEKGFEDGSKKKSIKKHDKIYFTFRNKTIFAIKIGEDKESMHLIASHIDSPRLDLKPHPLYEDSGLALFKSHYYGGIKKYQWVNTPLALHGIIYLKSGKKINLSIGEEPDEPKFIVADLLVHLSKDQLERKGSKVVNAEELNILVGSIPLKNTSYTEKIKLGILKKLNEKYGIVESDFVGADIEFVPAGTPSNIGFDNSLIAAYGHDDKSCVFTSLEALLAIKKPSETTGLLFVDKEEIGSEGATGVSGSLLRIFIEKYISLIKTKKTIDNFLTSLKVISADVGAGLNPSFKDVHDPLNAPIIGRGPVIYKYKGLGGKYYTDEASPEFSFYIKSIFENKKIPWQTGEGSKLDFSGGSTISVYLARFGLDVINVGPPVLSMHSTNEIISKVDLYTTFLFYKAFFQND